MCPIICARTVEQSKFADMQPFQQERLGSARALSGEISCTICTNTPVEFRYVDSCSNRPTWGKHPGGFLRRVACLASRSDCFSLFPLSTTKTSGAALAARRVPIYASSRPDLAGSFELRTTPVLAGSPFAIAAGDEAIGRIPRLRNPISCSVSTSISLSFCSSNTHLQCQTSGTCLLGLPSCTVIKNR